MFVKVMDEILNRWFRDGQFRQQLRSDPEKVLADYELTLEQRARLLKLKKKRLESGRETAVSTPANSEHQVSLK